VRSKANGESDQFCETIVLRGDFSVVMERYLPGLEEAS